MGKTEKRAMLFSDQVKKLSENTILGWAGSFISSIVLVIVLWEVSDHSYLLIWFVCIFATDLKQLKR